MRHLNASPYNCRLMQKFPYKILLTLASTLLHLLQLSKNHLSQSPPEQRRVRQSNMTEKRQQQLFQISPVSCVSIMMIMIIEVDKINRFLLRPTTFFHQRLFFSFFSFSSSSSIFLINVKQKQNHHKRGIQKILGC